jgi:hypothetical protein
MSEKRRKFDQEFREGAVRIVRETGKRIAQVARPPRPAMTGRYGCRVRLPTRPSKQLGNRTITEWQPPRGDRNRWCRGNR